MSRHRKNHECAMIAPVNFRLTCVLAVWALLQVPPASADPGHLTPTAVGYIEQLAGNLEDFSIERRGSAVPLALLLPLHVGDRLIVRGAGSMALLQCGNRSLRVTERDSPFVVPPVTAPPNFLTRLGSLLMEVGSRLTTQQAKTVTKVSTSSRGEEIPLAIPLLHDRMNQIPRNGAALYLGWTGGVPPYDLLLLPQVAGSVELVHLKGLEEPRVAVPLASALSPGFFRVEVTDNDGTIVRGTFEVVETMPSLSVAGDVGLQDNDLPVPLHAVMTADVWAQRNPAQWSLHAYQTVAPFGDSFEPARLLRDCLEESDTCHRR
jgi:hypothetical protein